MAWKFSVSDMVEQVKYAPRTSYKVGYVKDGEWTMFPEGQRASIFSRRELAEKIRDSLAATTSNQSVTLFKLETIFFSDLETKELQAVTEYSVLLV